MLLLVVMVVVVVVLNVYIVSGLQYFCFQCFDAVGWVAGREYDL